MYSGCEGDVLCIRSFSAILRTEQYVCVEEASFIMLFISRKMLSGSSDTGPLFLSQIQDLLSPIVTRLSIVDAFVLFDKN